MFLYENINLELNKIKDPIECHLTWKHPNFTNEKDKIQHVPRWFKEQINPHNNMKEYIYQGGYWESREKGYFENVMDIYWVIIIWK